MKKLFSLIAAVLFAGSMMAVDVVFSSVDFNGKGTSGTGSEVTVTKDGVTFTCDKAFGDQYGVRCYKGAVVTISSEQQIGKIVYEFATVSGKYYNGGLEEEIVVDAKSWTATLESQARMNKISIYLGNSGEIVEVFDTLTVAQAIDAAQALADNAESDSKVYVEGLAANVTAYSTEYNNQDFYLVDNASEEPTFMVYRAKPEKEGAAYPVLAGDKVRVFGALKKYVKDGATTLEIMTPSVEFLSEVPGDRTITPAEIDTITTAEALAIAQALAEPAENGKSTNDTKTVVVKGFAVKVFTQNEDNTWSFYMHDVAGSKGDFQASNATADRDVVQGDYIYLKGVIAKRKTNSGSLQYQIYRGTATHGEIQTINVNVTDAMAVGNALADNEKTTDIYCVTGYVVKISAEWEDGVQTFFISDDPEATYGDFQARLVTIADPGAKVGDCVAVTGPITKYVGASGTPTIQIDRGTAKVVHGQGIENITLTEKAQKVVVDGVIYIVRDNKMFNLQGAQVR